MRPTTTARESRPEAGRSGAPPNTADDIVDRAFSVVERLAAEYPAHARRDIERLIRLTDRLAAADRDRALHYEEISRVAHDIRGQGALFGYPLMTRCADSLCRVVRRLEPGDGTAIGLIRTHTAALPAILARSTNEAQLSASLFVATGLELLVLLRTRSPRK